MTKTNFIKCTMKKSSDIISSNIKFIKRCVMKIRKSISNFVGELMVILLVWLIMDEISNKIESKRNK